MNPSHSQVCDHFNTAITGGGWNKKEATAKGIPMGKAAQLWLKPIAPASFFPDKILRPCYDRSGFRLGGVSCTICLGIMERPLQLKCDHLVCLTCCNWLEVSHTSTCPCCYGSNHNPNHARTPGAAIKYIVSIFALFSLKVKTL